MGNAAEGLAGHPSRLGAYLSPVGAWAMAIGASIGWGSLVVTSSNYLGQAGPMGSAIGLLVGMGIMLIVAASYHFMMESRPGTGGVYAYARDIFGYDQGVLVAWFLAITYIAMFWANVTSLPLFARFFLGGVFQFGPSYTVFGYDVYLGEVLLCICAIAVAGIVCVQRKRGVAIAVVVMVVVIVAGIIGCFAGVVARFDSARFSMEPFFMPGSNALMQVVSIASISSWAFIGFESVSNSAGEFAFPHKRAFGVLATALVTVTALYILLTVMSVTAYPDTYASWMEYIADLDNLQGFMRIPAFFAAYTYLGNAGVYALMGTLVCLVFTSLITIIIALSRLLLSAAEDGVLPSRLSRVSENGVPAQAVLALVLVSLPIPLLGRTAIGWIVDVTTIGATIIYGFVSACALKDGRRRGNAVEANCGLVGLIIMIGFALYLMVPGFFARGSMATETYILFALWSMLGFVFFRHLLRSDDKRRFGNSVISWVMLLALTLFTCMAWMGQMSNTAVTDTVSQVRDHYAGMQSAQLPDLEDDAFAADAIRGLDGTITAGMFVISGMLVFSLAIMLSNFTTMRKREEESFKEANVAQNIANTDPLTGVKSKNAYVSYVANLNAQLKEGLLDEVGVVVCDVNGLKQVNDTLGHKAGDDYIRAASVMVCEFFKHSPVFRIGGDEFVVVLKGVDFENRDQILTDLNAQSAENRDNGKVVVAAGLAVFDPALDESLQSAFERADAAMYERKRALKGLGDAR